MVNLTKAFLTKLEKSPFDVLKTMTTEEIVSLIQKANHAYYNTGKALFDDQLFDLIKAHLEELQPNHPALQFVGSKVKQGVKSTLPFYMGSLDKIKSDEKVFSTWKKMYKGNYVISDKLDGNSGLLHYRPQQGIKLYSRGNGVEGQDISHLLPFLKNSLALTKNNYGQEFAVRGELIMSKIDFGNLSKKGANARNTVAGLLNAVIPDLQIAKYTSFIAYEVIVPSITPAEQMKFINENLNIDCVYNTLWHYDKLTLDNLSDELINRRKLSTYEIDGIVVIHNDIHPRANENPEYAFAFKSIITMEKAEVIVKKIEWNLSKDGIFVPVVHFTPVHLDGVIITKAHGFNAKYIKDNSLGAGAVIVVMRSGAVIPYIVETIVKAKQPDMPTTPYSWNKTGVDIVVAIKENNEELKLKNIQYFFDKIDVRGLSSGLISKIYNAGFKSVGEILHITIEELIQVEGIQKTLATKIHQSIHQRMNTLDIYLVMDASNKLGRGIGYKKIKLICEAIPHIVKNNYIPTIQELVTLKGVEEVTANQFITNLPSFFAFMSSNRIKLVQNNHSTDIETTTTTYGMEYVRGKTFVFSGVRNKELEDFIEEHGGKIASSVSKTTSVVVVKSLEIDSTKTKKAKSLSIPIMLMEDLLQEIEQ
jgi:NAD-dependent DNA ligase